MPLLEIRNLSVEFPPPARDVLHAVEDVTLEIEEGEIAGHRRRVGLRQERDDAGRHGSGAFSGPVRADRLAFDGRDLRTLSDAERRRLTGKDVAMIFQDPQTSLNPCFTVGISADRDAAAARGSGSPPGAPAGDRAAGAGWNSGAREPHERLSRISCRAA
jgi:dipeptide transport system ATP-binding protein